MRYDPTMRQPLCGSSLFRTHLVIHLTTTSESPMGNPSLYPQLNDRISQAFNADQSVPFAFFNNPLSRCRSQGGVGPRFACCQSPFLPLTPCPPPLASSEITLTNSLLRFLSTSNPIIGTAPACVRAGLGGETFWPHPVYS